MVKLAGDYDEIRERALTSGWQIGQEGDTPRGPFIYFLNEGHPGTVIEMAGRHPSACASLIRCARPR